MRRLCPKNSLIAFCFLSLLSASLLLLPSASLAATKYWIGSGSFSVDANWSTESGGDPDTTAPIAADDAIFDDGGTGDCSIDTAISVKGLKLESGYSGTLTQGAGATVTVGTSGYVQEDGTFVGGDADVSVYRFTLSGGMFTAPLGTLAIENRTGGDTDVFTLDGGSYYHNNGTLKFRSYYSYKYTADKNLIRLGSKSLELNNLIFSGGNYSSGRLAPYDLGADDEFVVLGDLLFEADRSEETGQPNTQIEMNGGTISLHGSLTVKEGIVGGTSVLKLVGDDDQAYIYHGGTLVNTVIVDKASGSVQPGLDPMDFPTKSFELRSGRFIAPDGLFTASGGYKQSGGEFVPRSGDVSVYKLLLSDGVFTAPTGMLTIAGAVSGATVFELDECTFQHNNGTLEFRTSNDTGYHTDSSIMLGSKTLEVNNLIFSGGNFRSGINMRYIIGADDEFVVLGDLLLEGDRSEETGGANKTIVVNGGTISLHGNLTVKAGIVGGTCVLKLVGDEDQTCTRSGGALVDTIIVDKPSGSVLPGLDPMDFPAVSFELKNGVVVSPNGLFSASKSYNQSGGTFAPGSGDMSVGTRASDGNFTLSGGSFTAPTGTLSIITSGNPKWAYTLLVWSGGDFHHNNGTLYLNSWITHNASYEKELVISTDSPLVLGSLILAGGNYHTNPGFTVKYQITSANPTTVLRDLVFLADIESNEYTKVSFNGGTVLLHGNLEVNEGMKGGATALTFTGTNDQYLTEAGGTAPTNSWTIDKTEGKVSLVTDFTLSGSKQDVYLNQGELNLDTNTFIIGKDLVASGDGPSALGVRVADADTAGLLVVSSNFTGIANLDLNVAVSAATSEVKGKTYQIVTNKAVLADEFKTVNWSSPWRGKVNYSENEGKEITLFDLEKKGGTMFIFR